MRKICALAIIEVALFAAGALVDAMTSFWPPWVWATVLIFCCVVAVISFVPEIKGWLRKHKFYHSVPVLKELIAPDGSITLIEAAFLWLEVPFQQPMPPMVQERLHILKKAIVPEPETVASSQILIARGRLHGTSTVHGRTP